MSSAVAEIQQDLHKERRSRGGGGSDAAFNEAEVCAVSHASSPMLDGFRTGSAASWIKYGGDNFADRQ